MTSDGLAEDLLAGAPWACCRTPPGQISTPDALDRLTLDWWSAEVPGTVGGALRAAGREAFLLEDCDDFDWWFRCRFPGRAGGPWTLGLDGLATLCDVWLNEALVLHSENMFVSHALDPGPLAEQNELTIRFAALTPQLDVRRPRPRFKSMMVKHQSLRWFRTTLLGRQPGWSSTPAPVGPWRPVRILEASTAARLVSRRVVAARDSGDGVVEVDLLLAGIRGSDAAERSRAVLRVGDTSGALTAGLEGDHVRLRGTLRVGDARLWWPHTHGVPELYPMELELLDQRMDLGKVGFRSVHLDRSGGGFQLVVNDVPIFCRGACWWPPDPVGMSSSDDELRRTLDLTRDAHLNMLRVPGGTVYEDDRFWDLCDELGVMVWQDCMLGYMDPPEDEAFVRAVEEELEQVFRSLGGHPSLVVLCGGQEIEEQAAFFGLPREKRSFPIIEDTIPALVERLLPGIPYLTSSPTGGELPFQPDSGDCHYWGVGSLLRHPDDSRLSGIRFMSEGMAFAVPPERQTVDEVFGGPMAAGHDPAWKAAVHHDTGRPFDLDDVRDHYVQELLHTDPRMLRYLDPERALDLGRAVVAELMSGVLSEWRRPRSDCAGGLLVALRDLVPGAGWGIVDSLGRPKAPWFAIRRALAPTAVLVSDEGLNGLHLNVLNDTGRTFGGILRMELFGHGELLLDEVEQIVSVPARGHTTIEAAGLLDGFRDIGYSYRYGPPTYDVVAVRLLDEAGSTVSEAVFLPAGLDRPVEDDIGLQAAVVCDSDGGWKLDVSTRRLAQWVVVEAPGYLPLDSWFHLPPGRSRTLALTPTEATSPPRGQVRALNARASVTFSSKD